MVVLVGRHSQTDENVSHVTQMTGIYNNTL